MRNEAVSLIILTLMSGVGSAQAPVPKALREAKTAYLVSDGAGQNTMDGLAKEFQEWGRFELVDDIADADIIITIGGFQAFKGWQMNITRSSDNALLWSDKRTKGMTSAVPKKLVSTLRKRLEEQEKQ